MSPDGQWKMTTPMMIAVAQRIPTQYRCFPRFPNPICLKRRLKIFLGYNRSDVKILILGTGNLFEVLFSHRCQTENFSLDIQTMPVEFVMLNLTGNVFILGFADFFCPPAALYFEIPRDKRSRLE